jgi:hypothetical protein
MLYLLLFYHSSMYLIYLTCCGAHAASYLGGIGAVSEKKKNSQDGEASGSAFMVC